MIEPIIGASSIMGGSGEEEAVGDGFGSGAAASAAFVPPNFGLVEWPLVSGDELRPFFDLPIDLASPSTCYSELRRVEFPSKREVPSS
jgi:hypothetical protein